MIWRCKDIEIKRKTEKLIPFSLHEETWRDISDIRDIRDKRDIRDIRDKRDIRDIGDMNRHEETWREMRRKPWKSHLEIFTLRTFRQTDQPRDTPSYRDSRTHLKRL